MKIDMTLLTHAHITYQQLAQHFCDQGLPTNVMLVLAALIVVSEAESRTIDAALIDVRDLAVELMSVPEDVSKPGVVLS